MDQLSAPGTSRRMAPLELLLDQWRLVLALAVAWVAGVLAGQVAYLLNDVWAFKVVDRLDAQRKPVIRVLHRLLHEPRGLLKATAFIFAVNLLGASFLQHTLLGVLLAPPFILLFTGGVLVSLLVRKYPERLLITLLVSPFEFGAFIVAAAGGVTFGMQVWGIGQLDVGSSALVAWGILFSTLVIPLQLLGAIGEAILAHRLPPRAWPPWLSDEQV